MRLTSLIILIFLISTKVSGQESEIRFQVYETVEDFFNKDTLKLDNKLIAKEIGENHIWVKKFSTVKNRKERKKIRLSFAIGCNEKLYYNLENSGDLHQSFTYTKFDIIGKYCAVFIDKNSPNVVKNVDGNYQGLGGVLEVESRKWNKSWTSKNGLKRRILFIDTTNQTDDGKVIANYLNREQVADLLGIEYDKEFIKNLSFEKVVEIIEEANAK